jgi:type IV pilus assembly protein PilF
VKKIRRCSKSAIATCFVFLLSAGCASNPSVGSSAETSASSASPDNQARAKIRLQLAVGYYEQRQMEIALDEIRQAIQADPGFADAYSVRGLIYMDMADNRPAEESFLQAIKLAPNNPDFNNNYGWFLCQTGRERQSLAYFEAALKSRAYQSPAKALNNAGVCSMKLNDMTAAERYFTQAFKAEPANLVTNANLGKLHYALRDYPRARFYIGRLTKSETVDPDMLWLAIKIERKLGDQAAETSLVTQLRRRYPSSAEYAAYQRGAFDE